MNSVSGRQLTELHRYQHQEESGAHDRAEEQHWSEPKRRDSERTLDENASLHLKTKTQHFYSTQGDCFIPTKIIKLLGVQSLY